MRSESAYLPWAAIVRPREGVGRIPGGLHQAGGRTAMESTHSRSPEAGRNTPSGLLVCTRMMMCLFHFPSRTTPMRENGLV